MANGEKIPTLEQYLQAARKTKLELVLEVKPHATPEADAEAVRKIVEMIGKYGLTKRVTYISFSFHALKELVRVAPAKTPIMYLGGGTLPEDLKKWG